MPKKPTAPPPMGTEDDKVQPGEQEVSTVNPPEGTEIESPAGEQAVEEESSKEEPLADAEFEAVLGDNSKAFFPIVDALNNVIDATVFRFRKRGVTIAGMDESHICIVAVDIPAAFFGNYEVTREGDIGVNLEDLSKIAGRTKGDAITLASDAKNSLLLVKAKGKTARQFKIHLCNVDTENIPPTTELDIVYNNYAAFPAELLAEAAKDAKLFGNTIAMHVQPPDTVRFTAESEVGEMECVLDKGHYYSAELKVASSGVFSLHFVEKILKIKDAADSAKWWFDNNVPLKVEYSLPSGATVKYFLAPRVEEEGW